MVESREVKERARSIGFSAVGIISLESLSKLPAGDVGGVHTLVSAVDELSSVRSAIILGYHI